MHKASTMWRYTPSIATETGATSPRRPSPWTAWRPPASSTQAPMRRSRRRSGPTPPSTSQVWRTKVVAFPPIVPADLRTGMDVFDDSTVWLGFSSVHDNDGGVLGDLDRRLQRRSPFRPRCGPTRPERRRGTGRPSSMVARAVGPLSRTWRCWRTAPPTSLEPRARSWAVTWPRQATPTAMPTIGEAASTRAFLIFGKPGPPGNEALEAGQNAYRTLLRAPATVEGLTTAGDVNGDGYADVLIRAGGTAYPGLRSCRSLARDDRRGRRRQRHSWDTVTGALGVGDVDGDQLSPMGDAGEHHHHPLRVGRHQ